MPTSKKKIEVCPMSWCNWYSLDYESHCLLRDKEHIKECTKVQKHIIDKEIK